MRSGIGNMISKNKANSGDYIADTIIDLCFVTSYKIEELLKMPSSRLKRLIVRYQEIYSQKGVKTHGK